MSKRQYIFLILLSILLYLSYSIIKDGYQNYIIEKYKQETNELNQQTQKYLDEANQTLKYIGTPAYKNKVLKDHQGLKMKGEKVIYLTHEETYNTFKTTASLSEKKQDSVTQEEVITKTMSNFQKWIYFLFKKDTR